MENKLIVRPEHSIYSLKEDGASFLRALSETYRSSELKMKKEIDQVQQRKTSEDFKHKILYGV